MSKKKHKECIKKVFDGVEVKIVKYDFLPRNTIALSTTLFRKLKQEKNGNI